MKAVFIEFLEAFGRACDKISFPAPPIIIETEDGEEYIYQSDEERIS